MSFPVQFDPDARREFLDAIDWYDQKGLNLGSDFFDAVDSALKEISASPEAFCIYSFSTHRYLLARFPYCIVYWKTDFEIWVMAVAHTSRRPGYWKERF